MRIGVLGTGMVGSTIGTKLVSLGHEVMMGSREAGGEKAQAWVEAVGTGASEGTFADAAAFGELVFNCTAGIHSVAALEAAGPTNLAGKILVDVANPLDFSQGFPPSLAVLQHGLRRRAAPASAPRGEGREGAQHDELLRDGRSRGGPGRPRRVRLRRGRRREGSGRGAPRHLRLAAASGSSTSAASGRPAAWRCTCRSGSSSWAPWAPGRSTSASWSRSDRQEWSALSPRAGSRSSSRPR